MLIDKLLKENESEWVGGYGRDIHSALNSLRRDMRRRDMERP